MRITTEQTVRGTSITIGPIVAIKRRIENLWVQLMIEKGFSEIELPSLEMKSLYEEKSVGLETQMYEFKDRSNRSLCLRPEGTATCQYLARTQWSKQKDITLFYVTRCWRYEKPQAGRYREFAQFGVEILNPTMDYLTFLTGCALELIHAVTDEPITLNNSVKRGLGYYTENGFEIEMPSLGAQKQLVGGGRYKEGIGFAIGLDRLLCVTNTSLKV
jgi:histidyl-tRNA synthetase